MECLATTTLRGILKRLESLIKTFNMEATSDSDLVQYPDISDNKFEKALRDAIVKDLMVVTTFTEALSKTMAGSFIYLATQASGDRITMVQTCIHMMDAWYANLEVEFRLKNKTEKS
jgi:hypothetical protein